MICKPLFQWLPGIMAPLALSLFSTLLTPCALLAQDPVVQLNDAPPSQTESLVAIRQRLDAQSRQLDALTREVIRLSRLIESGNAGGAGLPPTTPPGPGMVPAPGISAPKPIPSATVPTAPTAPVQGEHIVQKGETLTHIAKKYGVTLEELQNFNQIKDARLLQVDQLLKIPVAGAAPAPTAVPQAQPSPTP